MKLIKVITLFFLGCIAATATDDIPTLSTHNVHSDVAANGLEVHMVNQPDATKVSVRIYVRGGTLAEKDKCGSGLANAVKTMLLDSLLTKQRSVSNGLSACQITTALDYNSICFSLVTVPSELDLALAQVAEVLSSERFHLQRWRAVRERIINTMKQGDAEGKVELENIFKATAYPFGPVNYPLKGRYDSFLELKRSDLIKYYKDIFVANNFLIVIAGDVNAEKVSWQVNYNFKNLKMGQTFTAIAYATPEQNSPRWLERYVNVTQSYICVGLALPAKESVYAEEVALFYELIKARSSEIKKIINPDADSLEDLAVNLFSPPAFNQMLTISFKSAPNESFRAVRKLYDWLLVDSKKGWNQNLIEGQKQVMATDFLTSQIDPVGVSTAIGEAVLRRGTPFYPAFKVNRILSIKLADFAALLNKSLQETKLTTVILSPKKVDSVTDLSSTILATEKSLLNMYDSTVDEYRLENGTRLITIFNPNATVVDIQFRACAGLWFENHLNNGVFSMLGSIMDQNLPGAPSKKLANFNKIGMQPHGQAQEQFLTLSATVRPANLESALEQLCSNWVSPSFNENDLAAARQKSLKKLQTQTADIDDMANYLFRNSVFATEPYNMNILGSIATINRLDLRDLKNAHSDFITPLNTVIVISGTFDREEIVKIVRQKLKRYKQKAKSNDFMHQPDKFVLSNQAPVISAKITPQTIATNRITKVFNWSASDSLVVCGIQLPAINSTNFTVALPTLVEGAVNYELKNIVENWQDIQGANIIKKADTCFLVGYDTGWLYAYVSVPNKYSKAAVDKLYASFSNAMAGLHSGALLSQARATAVYNRKMQVNVAHEKIDKLSKKALFGIETYDLSFEDKLKKCTQEDLANFVEKWAAYPITIIVTPEK